jgi:hypothetical protein
MLELDDEGADSDAAVDSIPLAVSAAAEVGKL